MSEDALVAVTGSIVLPLVFMIVLGLAESLVEEKKFWDRAKDISWDLCVLGIGLTGGLFSDRQFVAYYRRFAPIVTAAVIGFDLLFAILILIFKKRYRESAGYGKISVLLGLLAIGMPASVLIWRF
jgi:hypothetical protein